MGRHRGYGRMCPWIAAGVGSKRKRQSLPLWLAMGSMDSHGGRVEMHKYVTKSISLWLAMGIGRKCYRNPSRKPGGPL